MLYNINSVNMSNNKSNAVGGSVDTRVCYRITAAAPSFLLQSPFLMYVPLFTAH